MTEPEERALGNHLRRVLAVSPPSIAVEYHERQVSWGELNAAAGTIEQLLDEAGVDRQFPVGWAARNRPAAVAGFVALILSERMVAPLRPAYAVANFRDDITTQCLAAVIGDPEDWRGEGVVDAARAAGTLGIEVSGPPFAVRLVPGLERLGPGPHREPMPGYVIERLTSGTTGAPKRIPVRRDALIPALEAGAPKKDGGPQSLTLQRSPALLFKPFSHAGGMYGLLLALYQARPIVLFEKFNVDDWVAAVKTYRPKAASLVPAMIRMLLDSNIDPADISSLLAIRSGTAPLEPALQAEFEARFGIPILIDYSAAEFIGGLAGWSIHDYRAFGEAKRGSVGRAKSEVRIRTVDPDNFKPQPVDSVGLIEVKSDRYGPDWIRTNDLAAIDADGFIFLKGRADDAINRGGFKVLPEDVAAVLRSHPAVNDAAVVAMADPRLGQVPLAAIELAEGAQAPESHALDALVRAHLPAYMVPVEYRILDTLPRTASLKISRPELKAILGV
jgi:acyl-CoA synthetase (AMP-forming)/AMP-acid ligase II